MMGLMIAETLNFYLDKRWLDNQLADIYGQRSCALLDLCTMVPPSRKYAIRSRSGLQVLPIPHNAER